MSKYEKLAEDILKNVGGKENVSSLTHCATRLRFNLMDKSKVNKEELKKLDIIQIVEAGGQFQVVIGPQVGSVYQEIMKDEVSFQEGNGTDDRNWATKIFDIISGSFTPLIPVFCGSGLIKALASILLMTNVLSPDDSTYLILSATGNAIFYFLPIILSVTIALKLKVSPYVAATVGAALLEPNMTMLLGTEGNVNFMGIPVIMSDYSSTVLPVFGAVGILYFLENFLKRIFPAQVHLVFVPFLSLLIMVPLTVIIFGPFGVYVGDWIAQAITFLISVSPVLTGAILSMVWIFAVMLGLHWALIPIMIGNIAAFGSDPLMGLMIGTVWAPGGCALGAFLKTKDTKLKGIAISGLIPCVLSGVSEPIMYGILFRYKRSLLYYTITAGITGAVAGIIGIRATQIAGGIFTIPTFQPILGYLVIIAISFILPVILHMVFGFEEKETNMEKAKVM